MEKSKEEKKEMRIAVASDHAGFKAKEEIKKFLKEKGYEIKDFGCFEEKSCDYPDFGFPAARAVASGKCDRGIFFCGSGNGMNIVANKVKGVRSAIAYNTDVARLAAEDTACKIICFGARFMEFEDVKKGIEAFLSADMAVSERHKRRVKKVEEGEDVCG